MITKERLIYAGIALLSASIVGVSFLQGIFSGPESALEDTLFSTHPVSSEVVLVTIDDRSITRMGQWPWSRGTFAKLLDTLAFYHPKAVGIDVLFTEPSRLGAADDTIFADALAREPYPTVLAGQAASIVLGTSTVHATTLLMPLPAFVKKASTVGLVNVISDRDGTVRRFAEPIESSSGTALHSFAAAVVLSAGHVDSLNGLPLTNRIVFAGPPRSVRAVSAADILDGSSVSDMQDKIIFIGATAESLHDSQKTPISGGTGMPGVEIHANIANMLLLHYRLTPLSDALMLLVILSAALIATLIMLFVRRFEMAILTNIGIGIAYLIASVVLFENGIVVNIIHLTFAWLLTATALSLYRFFSSEKERRMIRATFTKYVAPHVLESLLANPKGITLGGEEREVTVLFSDIRGFTTLSEKTAPIELVRILNTYFSAITKKIVENDGVLDKYIGDAIMAFWGAPVANPHQADQAVQAALEMVAALEELNKVFKANGDPEIKMGVGIYTGKAVVGNIGSEHRFDYTVIGDTVNAASRIEGLTKEYKTAILIGESTKNKLTKPFLVTPLGDTSVKGKQEKITIYGVGDTRI